MNKRILCSTIFLCAALSSIAQVKIGYNATTPANSAAVLELSNNIAAASNEWKSLLLPYVSFDNTTVFVDSSSWGIAGTAIDGAMVYDTSSRATNGFKGKGVYAWNNGAWVSLRYVRIAPPIPPFVFTNCGSPLVSGNVQEGVATAATATLAYANGNYATYPTFTSSTVSGITLSTPAGTLLGTSGTLVFTASGTPSASGNITIPVTINGTTCSIPFTVRPAMAFSNCGTPTITGNIQSTVATTATVRLNYTNGTGAAYPAFTSSTVSGITLATAAGTLGTGTGNITFNASGTPTTAGNITIPVTIAGLSCNIPITIAAPPPMAFSNCGSPAITGTAQVGNATNITVTLNYANGTGAAYGAFTSSTVNGITLTAPAGTLTSSTGSIVFTASGTPVSAGGTTIPVTIGTATCNVVISVAPGSGGCSDPGTTVGNTGCVTFTYRGASVIYTTVRAADNKIWIQQNLGSTQVATSAGDAASFGHYFQWGRWDDGHQLPTSVTAASTTLSPNNPLGLGGGSATYYTNSWWTGTASDTWSGSTATATNGIDPCSALGGGWHIPSSTEWGTVKTAENITNVATAFSSNLKLPASSYRGTGGSAPGSGSGGFWSNTSSGTSSGLDLYTTSSSASNTTTDGRAYGQSLRCMK